MSFVRPMILAILIIASASAQTTTTPTPVPVTVSIVGVGSGDANGGFLLTGAGTFEPYGPIQMTITGEIVDGKLQVDFEGNLPNMFSLGAGNGPRGGSATSNASGISGVALLGPAPYTTSVGTFNYSITPAFGPTSQNVQFTLTGSGSTTFSPSFSSWAAAGYPVSAPGGSGYPLSAGGGGSPVFCVTGLPLAEGCSGLFLHGSDGSISNAMVFSGSASGSNALVFQVPASATPASSPWITFNGSPSDGGPVLVFNGPSSGAVAIEVATPVESVEAGYRATASCTGEASPCWIAIPAMSASGTIAQSSSTAFPVTVNPEGLIPGIHQANVAIRIMPNGGTASTVNVPVTALVTSPGPALALSQPALQFQGTGISGLLQQFITVSNSGPGSVSFSAAASTLSGGNWLYVWPPPGTTAQSGQVVNIQANPAGLSPGLYYGSVLLTATGAVNSPQSVEVVLDVLPTPPPTQAALPMPTPASLFLVSPPNGPSAAQAVLFYNLVGPRIDYESKLTFEVGNGWLTDSDWYSNESRLCYDGGVMVPCPLSSVSEVLTANPALLLPGVYVGSFVPEFEQTKQFVPVPVILIAPSDCIPKSLVPAFTNLASGFQSVAGIPIPVQVEVRDNCGSPLNSGSVLAYFSGSQDPPVSLVSLGNGQWTGSWMPHNLAGGPANIGVIATSFAAPLYGSAGLEGTLLSNSGPVVIPGSVLSAASLAVGQPIAPGSYISIFGSNLAAKAESASSLPLLTTLAGTQVFLGDQPLLLAYAGPTQINAVVPFETPVNTLQNLTIVRNGAYSLPEPVLIAEAQPAVFTEDQSGTGPGLIVVAQSNGAEFLNTPATRPPPAMLLSSIAPGWEQSVPPCRMDRQHHLRRLRTQRIRSP